ncbi:MAG: aspartate/glutamate racemase family protein [Chlamydiales bacterium]
MKPKSIGIIGGAGPLAGVLLLERVLSLSQSIYGCHKDSDFPKVFFLNFPFSEMLSSQTDVKQVRKELSGCLSQMRRNDAKILAIACNTLHAFLDENDDKADFIHLLKVVAKAIPSESDIPLVLCTSTSARFGLHKRFFACRYPDSQAQLKIDRIIDKVLKGQNQKIIIQDLLTVLQFQPENAIILGCTELSLFKKDLSLPSKLIIDPLEILANKIVEKSFLN